MYRVYTRGAALVFRRSESEPAPTGSAKPRHRFQVITRGRRAFVFNTRLETTSGGGTTVSVPAGSLTLTGLAPTVTATANVSIDVPAGSLTLTGNAPTVQTTANAEIAVPSGSLTLTGYAPEVLGGTSIPEARNTGGGIPKRKRERYVVKVGDRLEVFSTAEEMEAYVEEVTREEAPKPKKKRAAIRIELAPQFTEEVRTYTEPPRINAKAPPSVALEQVRRLEKRIAELIRQEEEDEDDEVVLWLM